MKKEFLTPSMDIAKFDIENIVTDSAATTITNAEAAKNQLTTEGGVSPENIAEITLTW